MRRQNPKQIHSFLSKPVLGWVVGFIVCVLLLSTQFRTYVYEMNSVFIGLMLIAVPNVILKEKK
jgi:putative membrane protein